MKAPDAKVRPKSDHGRFADTKTGADNYAFRAAPLLHALKVHLGEAFRPKVRQGWSEVFGLIRRAMLSGFPAALLSR